MPTLVGILFNKILFVNIGLDSMELKIRVSFWNNIKKLIKP